MKFILDEEIKNLNGDDDLLETKKYANTLKEIIINSKTPFTIGLFGEWGSGKSSIVNTAQHDLEQDNAKRIKFIKYDAWKYANDSFRRMFLKTVQNALNIEGTSDFEAFYVDKNTTTKIDKNINKSFLAISIVIVLIGLLSIFNMPDNTSIEWKITIPLLIAIIGMSVSIAKNFFDSYKVTVQNPKIFAPEQFEDIFDEMVDSSMNARTITKPKKWIRGEFIENKIDKLVIIVDNIDRCDKETAYELLTNIKNFLERKGIVFVVPIDDSALRRHLKEKNNEDSKEADEFLRKFFNVNLKIKHFHSRDLFMFTNALNKKFELNLQPDTIDIIAKEYATNPRRIIQLLNNLISELNIVEQKYDNNYTIEYESLIAKLLIIREEWSCVYKQISNNPHILKKKDEILFDSDSNIEKDVLNFLTRTKAISENIDIQIIEKLVSNIDNDLKVSSEILEYIKNNEYDKVQEYIEDDESYRELMYYFLKELETEITRDTYKSGALIRFKNIIKLNELKEIPRDINYKLDRETSEEDILKLINNFSEDDLDSFYKFVDVSQKQKLKYLEKLVVKEYKEIWKVRIAAGETVVGGATIWKNGLGNFINFSSNTKLIEELKEVFVNYYAYFLDNRLFEEKWITEDKLQYIISKQFIDYLIDKVEPTLDDGEYKELMYLSRVGIIKINNIENIFTKLIEPAGERIENSNPEEAKKIFSEKVLSKLKIIRKLIHNVKHEKIKSEGIEEYLKFMNQTHSLIYPNPNNGAPQHNQKVNMNLIDSVSSSIEAQEELLRFYIEIYRATHGETDVKIYLKELITKYNALEESFFKLLIDLRDNKGYTLKSLFNYLIDFNSIDSNLFNLYEKLFLQDDYIECDEVKEKLNTLIKKYLSDKNETIENFLVAMLQNSSTKALITDIVVALPTENIVLLPKEIQQLTYDYLCENDKLFDIEDKIDFIKEVLNFDKKYKDCIVKIIVSKLQNKTKVKGALEILENFKQPSRGNKLELYTALEKQKEHTAYSKEVAKYMKRYFTKEGR